jgi:polygalacturonase
MNRRELIAAAFAACVAVVSAASVDVRDLGAKGDGRTKDTASIQSAIDKCAESGGGRVVLSDGTFLSGSIQLRTGVELHIDGTARPTR